jgi:tetratricopeptide (TPR) repeat protein
MLEEMQWADSASVDALDDLVEALPGLPVLLLLAYRPEWSHAWTGRSFYRQVNLPELTQEQSRRFLRQLLRAADLPDPVADVVIAHCGGNPLLLEETVKSLQERGALVARKGSWTLTQDVSVLQLPTNLRGIMMARLDRLEPQDRAVLQKASVIGRSFTYRVLALITGLDDELDESLERLQDQELILETPLAAEPEYTFKHTIVQEIAYNNLLVAERRVLHERVGDALERIGADRPDDQLEVLSYHYSHSGNKLKAIDYLIRSGEKARRLYANETAIAQFEEALEKYRSLPTQEQEPARLVHLYEVLGDVQLLIADFRSAQENFEAGLAEAIGADLPTARLWNRLGLVWERRGDYRRALRSYERGLAALGASPAAPRPLDQAMLQASAARAQAHRGDYAEAARLARAALDAIGRQLGPDEKRTRADALHVLGLVAYAGGQPDEALTHHLQSLELRLELGDTMGMQESYNQLGAIYWSRGQLDQAFEHLVSLTQVLRLNTRGLEMPSPGRGQTGNLAASRETGPLARDQAGQEGELASPPDGETAPIERFFRSGLSAAQQVGDLWGIAVSCNRLGGMLYRQGERERALYYLRRAVTEAERIGAREVAAQASINLGAILIGQGYADAGLKHLERGLTYAEAVDSAETLAEGHIRLAEGRLAAGDLAGALAEARAGLEKAAQVKHQFAQGLAQRVLGQVASARADWTAADRHFRAAMELLGPIDAQQEVGRTLFHFAQMWKAWSRAGHGPVPEGATVMLQQAAQIFQRLDMQQDLAAARAALLE